MLIVFRVIWGSIPVLAGMNGLKEDQRSQSDDLNFLGVWAGMEGRGFNSKGIVDDLQNE